jgi:hypothetical protein
MTTRTIFRQVISLNDRWNTIYLSGPIVHVATRHEDCVEIWFIDDPAAEARPRTLRVYGTGHAIDEPRAEHVGSAVTPSGRLVWHLMELPEVTE